MILAERYKEEKKRKRNKGEREELTTRERKEKAVLSNVASLVIKLQNNTEADKKFRTYREVHHF